MRGSLLDQPRLSMHSTLRRPEHDQYLRWLAVGAPGPVRHAVIKPGRLADSEEKIVVTEDRTHRPGEDARAQPRTSTISKEAGHVGAHGSARASHRVDQTTTGGSVWTVTPPFVVCVPQGHGLLLSGMVSTAVLATKLFAPVRRPQLVARHRVAERLNLALDAGHRLTLVSAPAGFGKTTLLSPDPPMCF